MPEAPEIHGDCDPRFTAVRDAMAANFREHDELGAAVAISVGGEPVVDIWAGWMDEDRTRLWRRDTLVDVFSVGKAFAAIVVLRLVERGQVGLDQPVAELWPEFGSAGKDPITLRMILSHRAGLPGVRNPLPAHAMYDWELMTGALAGEAPWWPPGSAHGYHVNSYGFLVGEIARRASGRRGIGELFVEEVADPVGSDFRWGVAPEDDERTADYLWGSEAAERQKQIRDVPPEDEALKLLWATYFNPPALSGVGVVNTREWRSAEMPSTSGHATARGIERVYAALAAGGQTGGVRVLEEETLDEAITEHSSGEDVVLQRPSRFGLGFQLTQPERPLGPNPRSFGHFGAGGSLGFADPDTGVAFAYVANRAGPRWQNPRNAALVDATYEALAGAKS
jgi:CubicO group peptidase (beta-lactamase class C family)